MSGAVTTKHPISIFLNSLMAGRSRDEFVRTLGYWKRIERGRRRLDLWLDSGDGDSIKILRQIAAAYPNAAEELYAAVEATRKLKAAEREEALKAESRERWARMRKELGPFVWVVSELGATSYFNAMAERHLKVIRFESGFNQLSESERLVVVQQTVRSHHASTGGQLFQFGRILAYRYLDTFDSSITFDPQGDVIKNDDELNPSA